MDCDSERIWQIVERQRLNVPKRKRPAGNNVSLFDRLHNCYVEYNQNSSDKSSDKRFRSAVNLLERVDPAHARVSLIVSLHSDERGYSLALCPSKDGEVEEIFLPYEDNEIFSYLDNQEIPPVLMEVLEKTQHCHLYNGCVVCEIRDYRTPPTLGGYAKHLLLLHPTAETFQATVNEIAQETNCSAEEKLLVESHLLVATQPPLCLETTTDVVCVTNRLQYNRRKYHTHSMRRYLRRRSQACRSRMHMMSEGGAPERLRLHDFILQKKTSTQPARDLSDVWKRPQPDLSLPSDPEQLAQKVLQHAQMILPEPVLAVAEHPPELPPGPALPQQQQKGRELAAVPVQRLPPNPETFANQLLKGSSQEEPSHTKPVKRELSIPATTVPPPLQTSMHQPVPTPPGPPSIPNLRALHPGMLALPPSNQAMFLELIRNQAHAQAQAQAHAQAQAQAHAQAQAQAHAQAQAQAQHAQAQVAGIPSVSRGGYVRTHRPIAPAIPSRSHSAKTLGAAQGQWTPTATVNVPGSTVNVVVSPLSTQPGVLAKTGAKGIVVVSRPASSQGRQMPAIVSVQQVSPLVRQPPGVTRAATPPLKTPHPPVRSGAPSPPILHTPPKLKRPGLPTPSSQPGEVQASMPKLTPLDPLKQPSPSPAPLPISGMPILHKMAVASPSSHGTSGSPATTAAAAGAKQAPPLKASPLVLAKRQEAAQQQQQPPLQKPQLQKPQPPLPKSQLPKSKKTPKTQKGPKGQK